MLIHELPLHIISAGVWCAISETRIAGPISFSDDRRSHRLVTPITLIQVVEHLSVYEIL
jgi:hypothetical protein